MGIFGDHGQSFCPIFTKIGTQGAFMGLWMMLKCFFANINMKAKKQGEGFPGGGGPLHLVFGLHVDVIAKNPFNIIHHPLTSPVRTSDLRL